ncbi:glycoprotein 3-alpha-L-fucosyltransferase A-like [Centruroides sculpturatus]|uniref:glycoprotein 3-alpha-L-fucosyltransferase A-like n=1 Tax=Centruroides sculpturatus TaxID=218467 RepID=UPI000C6D1F20|nr:glycoprotein 3-alpha-L-fucosyltransferase A-like [Centruroides sculpturatus]XP_023221232.1 glycoprotein 3-alpha-L-fucosyltransferase A-like [Centruroides sculpturatus]
MRKLAAALCCVSVFVVLLVYQLHNRQNYFYSLVDEANDTKVSTKPSNGIKIILTWTKFFAKKDWLPSNVEQFDCVVGDCMVTSDRRMLRNSSAIIFHWRDVNLHDLPDDQGDQVWILYNMESPMHTPRNVLTKLSPRLDWIVTYRHDSDFVSSYGRVVPGKEVIAIENKTSLVAWLVSNCDAASNREDYAHELGRYIQVDIYGNCGKKYCPHIPASECYRKLGRNYRFYLSFENSICKDYVTEKLFYAMKYGMIPIVFGGSDYKDILPLHSYIDTQDYPSPKVLAEYLHNLSTNEDEFASYFKWRDSFQIDVTPYKWLCNVCRKLHQNFVHDSKNTEDLESWWYKKSDCRVWKNGKFLPL